MGYSDLRKFLVERGFANRDRIPRRPEVSDPGRSSLSVRDHDGNHQSCCPQSAGLSATERGPCGAMAHCNLFWFRHFPGVSCPKVKTSRDGTDRSCCLSSRTSAYPSPQALDRSTFNKACTDGRGRLARERGSMRRRQLLRFSIGLAVEILCCAALNLFDDWTLQEMPVRFVTAAMLGGIAFLFAIKEFPVWTTPRTQAFIFWSVA